MSNEQELITLGEGAEQLLSSEAFTATVNSLVNASFQTFTNSKPGELENREKAYHHYRALVDIVSTLQQRVAVKDEIVAKAEDNSNQEEDD